VKTNIRHREAMIFREKYGRATLFVALAKTHAQWDAYQNDQ
jgi:hypothetical protein